VPQIDRSEIRPGLFMTGPAYAAAAKGAPPPERTSEQLYHELMAKMKVVEEWVVAKEKAAADKAWFDKVWLV
jgi:hypothetical protein